MPPRKKLSKTMMVRMDETMRGEVEAVARANKLSASDIIRIAMAHQLPALRSGQLTLKGR